ncbi:MAG: hypothetical protein AMXMBFR34_12560 [Myxococcaceae bacterium]
MRVDQRTSQPAVSSAQPKTWTTPAGNSYSEPAAGAALARGHGGERVLELQKRLNAAGANPRLAEDGLFGPKTEATLQKLTGQASFDAAAEAVLAKLASSAGKRDDFQTPGPTPSAPQTQAIQTSTVSGPPPSGSIAERTLQVAERELGSIDPRQTGADGKYHGWQHLQTIFEKTTGWRPTDKEVQASSQPQKKSWCGIFATHVLQEAGAHVRWDLSKGKMVGDVQQVMAPTFRDYRTYKAERQAFQNSIKPGDVITLNGALNHHAIVTSVNPDGTVNTIDGNKPHVGTGLQKLSDVTSYYRPTTPEPKVAATQAPESEAEAGGRVSLSTDTDARAEAAAQANPARTKPVPLDSLGDLNARRAFVQNVVQLDGITGGSDTASCGPTALVSGMLMADPKSVQKLAGKILEMNSKEKKALFGDDTLGEVRAQALRNLRDGTASPADVQVLSQVIGARVMKGGSTAEEMMRLVGGMRKLLGSDMPNLSLHLYSSAKDPGSGLHWQAYANGVEIDPWPNEKGQATLLDGKDGLRHGAGHFKDGTCHSKLIIEDHGKRIVVPRYVAMSEAGQRIANPNPNVPLTNYTYEMDLIGYSYSRTRGNEPAGTKWEPPAHVEVS